MSKSYNRVEWNFLECVTLRMENKEIFTTMLAAWFLRNKEIFTDEKFDPVILTAKFHNMVQDYNAYATKVLIPP